jgi:hypothetical protein
MSLAANVMVFFYGVVAMFVIAAVDRNRRESRAHAPVLTLVGWGLMSTSFAAAALMLALAAGLIATS